jgi:hypothetical protein
MVCEVCEGLCVDRWLLGLRAHVVLKRLVSMEAGGYTSKVHTEWPETIVHRGVKRRRRGYSKQNQ